MADTRSPASVDLAPSVQQSPGSGSGEAVTTTQRSPHTGQSGQNPNVFTEAELAYLLSGRRLARLATVGPDGMPHVAPVGWSLAPGGAYIEVSGRNFAATKKFRDVVRTGRAAIVIDDVLPPWQPRGLEIRGRAEAVHGPPAAIRIHPRRIVAWGVDESTRRSHTARSVPAPGAT